MTDRLLRITWPDGELTAQPGQEVTIGRDPEATVVLSSPAVSRRHARVQLDEDRWTFEDLGSTQGSFAEGSTVQTLAIADRTTVVLGRGTDAVTLVLASVPPTRAADELAATRTSQPADGPERPGGALAADLSHQATVVPATNDERAVRLSVGDETVALRPGQTATLGRESDNALVLTDPAVSRHHARVEHDDSGWVLVDLGSAAGTWLDGARVTRVALVGEQEFLLGDKHGTAAVRTSAPGAAASLSAPAPGGATEAGSGQEPPRSRRGVVAALVAGVLLVTAVGAGVWWWLSRSGADTDTLARATVDVSTEGWGGSGTVIDAERGLILTNAHVASPTAMGSGVRDGWFPDEYPETDAERRFIIAVNDGTDTSAEPRYVARVVAADGYLDLAVLQIETTLAGSNIGPGEFDDLVEVPIGDSDQVGSGETVTLIGYPGAADSTAPTLTEGVISGIQGDPRLAIDNAWINTDAVAAHGNSGGLAANEAGELIGVPSLLLDDNITDQFVLSAIRPVALAEKLIDAAIAGTEYESPWTEPAPGGAAMEYIGEVSPADVPVSEDCRSPEGAGLEGLYGFGVAYEGLTTAENTDVLAGLYSADGTPLLRAASSYPTSLDASGCLVFTFATQDGSALPPGDYLLRVGVGGNYETFAFEELELGGQTAGGEAPTTG